MGDFDKNEDHQLPQKGAGRPVLHKDGRYGVIARQELGSMEDGEVPVNRGGCDSSRRLSRGQEQCSPGDNQPSFKSETHGCHRLDIFVRGREWSGSAQESGKVILLIS